MYVQTYIVALNVVCISSSEISGCTVLRHCASIVPILCMHACMYLVLIRQPKLVYTCTSISGYVPVENKLVQTRVLFTSKDQSRVTCS